MEKIKTMSFEEAWEYNNNVCVNKEEIEADEEKRQQEINLAVNNWNWCIDRYEHSKNKILQELVEVLKDNDSLESLIIKFEPIEDFVKRIGYIVKFTAWSENWVYVCGEYDGNLWVEAISRNPSDYLIEPIGG